MIKTEFKTVRFKEVVQLKQGMAFNSKNNHLMVDEGVPLLRIVDLNNKSETRFVNPELVSKRFISQPTDLIYSRTGVLLGLVYTNRIGVVHNNCFRIIPKKDIDYMYLYWYLKQPSIINHARSIAGGAAQPDLNHDAFKSIFFTYPDLLTQTKIANILSAYDDLIGNNNQRIKLLEEMAEEIYKEWFVRFRFPNYKNTKFLNKEGKEVKHGTEGALPEGWEEDKLGNHLEYFRGKSYSSEELRVNEGLPMLNLKNINRGGSFRRDGLKFFEGKYTKRNEARFGDIIMAVTDMTQEREIVGRVAIVPDMGYEKFIISMDLVRIEPLTLPKLYLYSYFRYSGIGLQLKEFANGVNVLHLTPDLIGIQKAIIPATNTCLKFEEILSPMIKEIDVLNNKNQILKETRDLLLPRLISGKLSVEELEIENYELGIAAEPVVEYKTK